MEKPSKYIGYTDKKDCKTVKDKHANSSTLTQVKTLIKFITIKTSSAPPAKLSII